MQNYKVKYIKELMKIDKTGFKFTAFWKLLFNENNKVIQMYIIEYDSDLDEEWFELKTEYISSYRVFDYLKDKNKKHYKFEGQVSKFSEINEKEMFIELL